MGSIAVSQDGFAGVDIRSKQQQKTTPVGSREVDIIDIQRVAVETNLKDDIIAMWNPTNGPRKLPTLLLYNERGLQLFEDITYLEEYYLTNNEIEVLQNYSTEIAQNIAPESMVIELGSGNLRKVSLLLQAFEDAGKPIDYYALDLSLEELERTLAQVPKFQHVRCHGLLGTYDDGREWLKKPENLARKKCILSLGSSIGNFERYDAAGFLKHFSDALSPADTMLIGLDGCCDPAKVYHAYNDKHGVTHRFILNGLENANEILGEEAFKLEDWEVIGEYVYDEEGGRHQAFYSPVRDTYVMGTLIQQHERIQVEQSLKYSQLGAENLWNQAGLIETAGWSKGDEHGIHLISKKKMPFSLLPDLYAASPCPSMEDWKAMWTAWDTVTQSMLPGEELHDKPIKLRNACIFYLGHIPAFLDIQLTKTTKTGPTEPRHFQPMFERGIDPDVDNPEKCHSHSEIPDEWPRVEEILEYQQRVRARLLDLYKDGIDRIPRSVAQGIWVGFEHEAMHMETLLYMMLQSDKTLPPPEVERPDFRRLADKARVSRVPNEWHDVPAQSVTIGMDEPDLNAGVNAYFGWDNEKPARKADVHAFQAKGRPITNEEYAHYMFENHIERVPASWADVTDDDAPKINGHTNGLSNGHTNGHVNGHTDGTTNGHTNGHNGVGQLPDSFLNGMAVRTVFGLVPLKYALDWPIFASYDELSGCAAWMGGRVPTLEEARSIYTYVHNTRKMEAEQTLGRTVPAVNGHLSNDGVEETPPRHLPLEAAKTRKDLFADLDGANVGFQHWHPVPVTADGGRLAGQGELGGVWEWTSSPLARHEGFEPMPLYPQYTTDFFDGKHNIVLGGSWSTHPIIAGRRSFVNWYQRNYPYAWAGARLVRDAN
ncbi:Ergothioneine biosynthesis protein 1 [Colletotrichum trifolii]|uniref:Ergothioneine biosynthesis protein 1 n=1 Tax=Colletotrichum trifolii TaxID=5466 RepID=A0A4R8RM46_COLTR|nr:Ergothioneine biosynthesis protein 1 [Colletotrichum trifolii]